MTGVYPIGNRPQDLQIDFFYIQRQVGKYLGYGYAAKIWDDEQKEAVQEIIDEGVRQYYFPPMLPEAYGIGIHEWSFMRPVATIKTESDQRRYNLPEDFERPIGDLSYNDTDNDFYSPVKWTSPTRLLKLQFQTNFTSYPQYAAYEPIESQGDGPQIQQLVLHPTPDTTYELTFQYQALARRLTDEHPYPLGNQMHGSGMLASCLAVAELRDMGADGPMYKKFLEKLAGNIARDHERGAALLGSMSNGLTAIRGRGMLRDHGGIYYNLVTYAGSEYTGQ
jgi:hypothetical protein